MPPLCLAKKSSCIHLFRTSNIAWPSTLNCTKLPSPPQVYISPPLSSTSSSPVYPCVVVISIFSVLQLITIFNTPSHPCSLITFIMFSCFPPLILLYVRRLLFPRSQPFTSNDASVIFTPHTAPRSPIPSSSSTPPSSPQPSATPASTPPPLPLKRCLPIYKNTDRTTLYSVSDL